MEFFYNNYDALFSLLFNGILGAMGQALRIWLGVYKLNKKNNLLTTSVEGSDSFITLGGVFIGFLVGITLTLLTKTTFNTFSLMHIVALIASGYTVTDCIEISRIFLARKQNIASKSDANKNHTKELSSNPNKNEALVSY